MTSDGGGARLIIRRDGAATVTFADPADRVGQLHDGGRGEWFASCARVTSFDDVGDEWAECYWESGTRPGQRAALDDLRDHWTDVHADQAALFTKTAENNARTGWLARLTTYDQLAGRQSHLTQGDTP